MNIEMATPMAVETPTGATAHLVAEKAAILVEELHLALLESLAPQMTCSETEAFVELYKALGVSKESIEKLRDSHAQADEWGDDHYLGDDEEDGEDLEDEANGEDDSEPFAFIPKSGLEQMLSIITNLLNENSEQQQEEAALFTEALRNFIDQADTEGSAQ